jgi:hypothetical protein
LILKDDTSMIGHLVAMHVDNWEFKCNGRIEIIPVSKINRLVVVNNDKPHSNNAHNVKPKEIINFQDSVNADNNGNSEVILSPTAIPLKKGANFFETVWGYYNYAEFGIGKGFSLGVGGFLPILSTRIRWGKCVSKGVHVGVSNTNYSSFSTLFQGNNSSNSNTLGIGTVGILSGNVALGATNRYLNIGAGFTYILTTNSGYERNSSLPIFSVGGAFPIAKKWAFLSDNIILPLSDRVSGLKFIFPSAAFRYFYKDVRFDGGFWAVLLNISSSSSPTGGSQSQFFPLPIPYFSFGIKF